MIFGKEIANTENILTLDFCGHHGNRNFVELTRTGWMVLEDERSFRIEDPKDVSRETSATSTEEGGRLPHRSPEGDDPEDPEPISA